MSTKNRRFFASICRCLPMTPPRNSGMLHCNPLDFLVPPFETLPHMTHRLLRWLCPLAFLLAAAPVGAQPVSYRNEVMAVLSRAGCNQGICHGNLNGRGGFKLSLRGQDLEVDRDALTRGMLGRRVNPLDPDASLLLQKASGQVPHEGGLRFAAGSNEYNLLRSWIAGGLKLDPPSAPMLKSLTVTPAEQ